MAQRRVRGAAAVFFKGVCAGTIDSMNGNAIATPIPRRTVRRDMNFFVINIRCSLFS